MSWLRRVSCQMSAWQESRTEWKADRDAFVVDQKAVRKTGKLPEHLGPPPSGFALLPWLLMGMGAFSNLFQGKTPNPWIGGIGLLVFNSSTSMWCSGPSPRRPARPAPPGAR